MKRMVAVAITSAFVCGCAETRTIEHTQVVAPPAALLECRSQPEPPAPPVASGDVATYILDLAEAGGDCRGKLAAVRDFAQKAAAGSE